MISLAFLYYTVRAFNNGWRFRALVPGAVVYGICLLIGFFDGLNGGDGTAFFGLAFILESGGALTARYLSVNAPAEAITLRQPIGEPLTSHGA